ncbi:MAG: L-serine ammonia-lyase [Calditrichaceae bacterium]
MESIKEIFRIGNGPSSSHTMGPKKAAQIFKSKYPEARRFEATLYGSLAATGKGHQTDIAITGACYPKEVKILWKADTFLPNHPNGMRFRALSADSTSMGEWTVYSVGGGKITDYVSDEKESSIYELTTMNDILKWSKNTGKSFWEYVESVEGPEINDYLREVWAVMLGAISRGIDQDGIIPGGLKLNRKASSYYVKAKNYSGSLKSKTLIFSYALAVAEENAAGGIIATAPTCGSSGVLPAVLKTLRDSFDFSERKILRALATAGLIGNIVKKNASISGAKVGCQGEIGTACAMASAAATQLLGGTPSQIEYAAEMGMEHHLGLTCDPIAGLVQVPCIERNAFASERALNTATYALLSDGRHLVSFDKIVKTMNQTGHDLPSIYKETSAGGLAILDL